MPKVTSPTTRALLALVAYAVLVFVWMVFFFWVRQGVAEDSPVRYAYALSGTALALYTHMGYFLFVQQTLLLAPWLFVGALYPPARTMCVIGFFGESQHAPYYCHS